MDVRKPMPLALLLTPTGTHTAAWRHPDAPLHDAANFEYFRKIAESAERSYYDLLFIADSLFMSHGERGGERRYPRHPHLELEPLSLLSALSVVTKNIGLAATVSTTYSFPYTLARAFASLDHLSGGRAGWNLVTSQSDLEAQNYGLDAHLLHSDRYARAAEYVDVVRRLWDSWEEDALVGDKDSGIAIDPSKLHALNHKGEYYSVKGPLNVSRPPQGRPVIIQAGSSNTGQDLAAATADIVFTAQTDKQAAQLFYRSIKDRLAANGRTPESLIVMPGVYAVVGETDAEAQEKFAQLQDLIHPEVGRELLAKLLGKEELSNIDVDKPLPMFTDVNTSKSRLEMIQAMGADGTLTVRELYQRLAPARGHLTLVGSAQHVADTLIEWRNDGAADGFMLIPGVMPQSVNDFDRLVLPILRDHGVARRAYDGTTLRERLGLPRPTNSFTSEQSPSAMV
ncbi:FMN-dependent oxidoreductase (nitrilotriacetate monooxygenase family) [Paraburkholderia unamae]|uniref:FMN-dependent oxidoreductase (Nitrilotriacetate monooxygenase family) n=2 Tax=Paraburkholderia unamae TaxID=219649 RepID=A0ABX5KWQ0_9BURK|nr:FMN-dependent oxidoreductase (nitrilotriacetate monooxygenase family) [Paraburkholderia unamae]